MAGARALGDFLKSVKSRLMEVATQFRTLPSIDEGLVPRLGQLFVTDVASGTDYEKVISHYACSCRNRNVSSSVPVLVMVKGGSVLRSERVPM